MSSNEEKIQQLKKLLEDLESRKKGEKVKCLHKLCPECKGTGIKRNGDSCVHYISCACPRCSPSY